MKVVPRPSSLSMEMVPPCLRIICRQRARPMPVPAFFVVKKGMKACARTSGDMPQPLSRTQITDPPLPFLKGREFSPFRGELERVSEAVSSTSVAPPS